MGGVEIELNFAGYNVPEFLCSRKGERDVSYRNIPWHFGEIVRALRSSKKAPGAERIYTAGEKEYFIRLERKDTGVPVSESVQNELIAV
jgi:hypothetical protein